MNEGILKNLIIGLGEMVVFITFLSSLFAFVILADALINPGVMP